MRESRNDFFNNLSGCAPVRATYSCAGGTGDMTARRCSMILASWVMLGLATTSVQAGAEIDVELRLIALDAPSDLETTIDLNALPGQISELELNDPFVLELWVSDLGTINTGIVGFYVDLAFDKTRLRADTLTHSSVFAAFVEGVIDNDAGEVVDFGGVDGTFTGQGVAPEWAKIGYVEMTVIGEGMSTVASSLGIGGVGVYGRQPPPVSEIQFGTATVGVPECIPTLSAWGLMLIGLLTAVVGAAVFRRRGATRA